MNQQQYSALSQGPTVIPMENYAAQPRIQPEPVKWCNARRTKVIIAIVILSILWVGLTVAVIVVQLAAVSAVVKHQDEIFGKGWSSTYNRNY